MTNEALRQLCIDYDWFTAGTSRQYDKLFKMNEQGCPVEELALIIWLCSYDEWSRECIECKLRERISKEV